MTGAFLAVRGEAVEMGIRLDPGYPLYVEDLDFCHQLARAGYRVIHNPETWVVHFKGQAPLPSGRRRLRRLGESRFHRKRGGPGGVLLAALYWVLGRGWERRGRALPGT